MNKLKLKLFNLKLSYKKEIITYFVIAGILLIGGTVAVILTKNIPVIIGCLGALLVFTYFYFSRYSSMEKKQKQKNLLEFVNLFTFFRMYLKNGMGVYTSLREISAFANPSLKELLDRLLNDIDKDKTITPFINFAHNFDELVVEEMMISIYQMVDDGTNSSYLLQFELIFDKFSELLHKKQLDSKDKTLSTLTSSALVGSAYLIVFITFGVINLLGVMISGI